MMVDGGLDSIPNYKSCNLFFILIRIDFNFLNKRTSYFGHGLETNIDFQSATIYELHVLDKY